mmetsp:Transcript_16847/g.23078  ORF Transcript_16847/g.23078 Transcript_16847/m.23078 type:complete len:348 (-) Transcript_16847:435-1478(-)
MSQRRNYYNILFSSSPTSSTSNNTSNRSLQRQASSSSFTTEDNNASNNNNIQSDQEQSDAAARGSFASHEPVSPPSGIEQFFLPQLDTTSISAFALASEIKKEQRSSSFRSRSRNSPTIGSITSGTTEDFQSACDSIPDPDLRDEQNLDGTEEYFLPARTTVVTDRNISTFPIEETEEINPENTEENIMTDAAPAPTTPTDEGIHLDATQHVYEAAKNVWGFGKNIFFVKPFLGLTETIATKVVGELKDVDDAVKPHIANIDNSLFNPVVNAVVSFVMPAVSMVDPVVRPVYTTVLRPFGLFKEVDAAPAIEAAPETEKAEGKLVIEEKKGKKGSTAPEVTAPVTVK